jgi:hypothetical protein
LTAKPSPHDGRDFPLSKITRLVGEFPETYARVCGKIKDQGYVGCCVGESLAYCREICEMAQSGEYKEFSPGFTYGLRTDGQYVGEGTVPREALDNMFKIGAVLQNEFPTLEEMPTLKGKVDAVLEGLKPKAYPFRISAYARVYSVSDIKTALMQLGAVSIMIPVYGSFYNVSANNPVVPIPTANETLYGYHQMTIVGWRNDDTWMVLNSWGEGWGDKGVCYIPFTFPIVEAWSITDNINPFNTEIMLKEDSTIAIVNGQIKYLDVSPTRVNDRLLVPIRFIAEAFGATVTWDEDTQIATIIL